MESLDKFNKAYSEALDKLNDNDVISEGFLSKLTGKIKQKFTNDASRLEKYVKELFNLFSGKRFLRSKKSPNVIYARFEEIYIKIVVNTDNGNINLYKAFRDTDGKFRNFVKLDYPSADENIPTINSEKATKSMKEVVKDFKEACKSIDPNEYKDSSKIIDFNFLKFNT